jgi:hypothetical protein
MDRSKWIITGVVTTLVIALVVIWLMMHRTLKKPRVKKNKQAPVCLLAGDFKSRQEQKGFDSLNTMVRLRFDVSSIDECKQFCSDYCHSRATDGFTPGNLVMTFRVDPLGKDSLRFAVTGHCIFEKIVENE